MQVWSKAADRRQGTFAGRFAGLANKEKTTRPHGVGSPTATICSDPFPSSHDRVFRWAQALAVIQARRLDADSSHVPRSGACWRTPARMRSRSSIRLRR